MKKIDKSMSRKKLWTQPKQLCKPALSLLLVFLFMGSSVMAQSIPESYADGKTADWNDRSNPKSSYIKDAADSHDDDQFTQGSKDEDLISNWAWSEGNTNNKGDITNAGAQITDNDCILRFFGDRTSNNGSAAISFWFFVNPVGKNANGSFDGEHTNGDILIISEFVKGGKVAELSAYIWMNGKLEQLSTTDVAWDAAVNGDVQAVPAGLSYTSADKGDEGSYPVNTFFEGAISLCDLKKANPVLSTCFSSFMVQTRNSHSLNAALQDFAGGNFNLALEAPEVTLIQPTCTVATGTIKVTSDTEGLEFSLNGDAYAAYPEDGFTGLEAGDYTLQVRNSNGCTSDVVEITIDAPLDGPNVNAGADMELTCEKTTVTLAGSSTTEGATYLWVATDGGNIVSGETTLTPIVDAAGTYTVTVTLNGCSATDVVVVTRDASTPNVSAIGGTLSCEDGTFKLISSSTTEGVTFSWTGPDNFASVEQNPTVTVAGSYKLTVTSAATGCSASITVKVKAPSTDTEQNTVCRTITFNQFNKGLISTIETEEGSVAVMGRKRNPDGSFASENHAAIFDSQAPTGDDTDLYTTTWGKVLIINQDQTNIPNDNQWGGELILDFSAIGTVTMESLKALDVDGYEDMGWVYLYDGNGNELYKVQLQNLGDNSRQTVNLGNTKGVLKMRVVFDGRNDVGSLAGSGAIDDIKFCVEEESSQCVDTEGITVNVSISDAVSYPNPFNDRVTLEFKLRYSENYVVNLYNLRGELIKELKSGTAIANELNLVEVDGRNLMEGMYLIRVVSGSESKTIKVIHKR